MADKATEDIERKRKSGLAITGREMDSSHRAALKALIKRDKPTAPLEEEEARRGKILGAIKSAKR